VDLLAHSSAIEIDDIPKDFSPHRAVRPHETDIYLEDSIVGNIPLAYIFFKLPHGGVTLQIANSLQKVASPLIWWKRGSSRRLGGFALSLRFHVSRAAMPHIAMVPVTAIVRTIN
jgi:hypothetical protein